LAKQIREELDSVRLFSAASRSSSLVKEFSGIMLRPQRFHRHRI